MNRMNSPALMNAPTVLDRDEAVRRLNGDAGFFNDLAKLFVEKMPEQLAEIRRAAAGRDFAALARTAHRLNGVLGIFMADSAAHAAQRLGDLARTEDDRGIAPAADALELQLTRLQAALQDFID